MRTCLGCGKEAAQAELFRLTVEGEGEVRVDGRARAPGRGAYVCGVGCFGAALKKKSLGRAFRKRWKGTGLEQVERTLTQLKR
ncbi:MAG: YlxR family protein [Myxococcaceae bacterium]